MKYKTASAFRTSLSERLNKRAREEGQEVNRLMKLVAFERLLARLFVDPGERWVLKGGYALELRLKDKSRSTQDIDLSVPPPPLVNPLDTLQEAAERDLGDFFVFRILPTKHDLSGPPLGGKRFLVEALLDGRTFTKFPLDLGQGDENGPVEWVKGQVDLGFADVPVAHFPVYPLADHFAEKLHAYTRPRENASRTKDLLDLLLIIDLGLMPSPELRHTVAMVFERYGTHPLPTPLPEPPASWDAPFAELADEAGHEIKSSFEAYRRLERFWQQVKP